MAGKAILRNCKSSKSHHIKFQSSLTNDSVDAELAVDVEVSLMDEPLGVPGATFMGGVSGVGVEWVRREEEN